MIDRYFLKKELQISCNDDDSDIIIYGSDGVSETQGDKYDKVW
jgi:hypothetical protein